jgi:hypothetical protein
MEFFPCHISDRCPCMTLEQGMEGTIWVTPLYSWCWYESTGNWTHPCTQRTSSLCLGSWGQHLPLLSVLQYLSSLVQGTQQVWFRVTLLGQVWFRRQLPPEPVQWSVCGVSKKEIYKGSNSDNTSLPRCLLAPAPWRFLFKLGCSQQLGLPVSMMVRLFSRTLSFTLSLQRGDFTSLSCEIKLTGYFVCLTILLSQVSESFKALVFLLISSVCPWSPHSICSYTPAALVLLHGGAGEYGCLYSSTL